jgi:hypothetical protein
MRLYIDCLDEMAKMANGNPTPPVPRVSTTPKTAPVIFVVVVLDDIQKHSAFPRTTHRDCSHSVAPVAAAPLSSQFDLDQQSVGLFLSLAVAFFAYATAMARLALAIARRN